MITFERGSLKVEDVVAIANCNESVELNNTETYRNLIKSGSRFIDDLLKEDGVIYGVTTGYGDSCTVKIPPHLVAELPKYIYTFHGCGLGEMLEPYIGRAVLAARLNSLSQGYSGVSVELLEQLVILLNKNIVPVIPAEGSVGASGDLTPLSYVAAVLCGERDVYFDGGIQKTKDVFKAQNIKPLKLRPKEGLAIMNGTAVMTGIACLAFSRAQYLAEVATRITAINTIAIQGNPSHFSEALFKVKPHKGQQEVAAWLRQDLDVVNSRNSHRLQDRYSLRCAPHVIGVLKDTLPWLRQLIENELNSANDNPIIDSEDELVLHGGHFYGGHIALAMDTLKNTVANVADLLDRQLAMLVDVKFNNGLPQNLTGAEGDRKAINHGFKAVQIGVSAWTAEALKLTMPASVFSRSTECHNQDKVSMGTIAARDCLRVLQLTEQVCAASLMAACQAFELRMKAGTFKKETVKSGLLNTCADLREVSEALTEDRALDAELRIVVEKLQSQAWSFYSEENS